jgi:O-antigen/teichoic acid export membrane protein
MKLLRRLRMGEGRTQLGGEWAQLAMLFGEAFLFLLSGAVIAIVLSRWQGAELFGQYSLVLAWLLLFQGLGGLGIPEFAMREIGRVGDSEGKYISHGLIIGMCASVTSMLIMACVVALFNYPKDIREALLLSALALLPMTASAICRGGFIAHKQTDKVFLVAFIECFAIMGINGYLAINGYGIVSLVITIVGAKLVTSLLSLYLLNCDSIKVQLKYDASFCRALISPLISFALSNTLGMISMRINLIMLSIWSAIATVGLYAAASKIMEMVLVISGLFTQLLLPRFAKSYAEGNQPEIIRYCEKLLPWQFTLTIPLALGLSAFAQPVLLTLFGAQFADADGILFVLMIFCIIENADGIMGAMLKAAGHQSRDVRFFSANLLTNVGLSYLLIPVWGGLGAAVAKLLGVATSSTVRYLFISRNLLTLNWLRITAKPLLVSAALLIVFFLLRD